ncbi:MAG: hypothetical protein ACREM3_18020 [Candidatus Rokuibacteriota bacterium]
MSEHKPAPAKMVHFLSEVLLDLPVRGRVVSVEVENASYLVTLALPDQGRRVHQLSVWDVSRSMRGDPTALAAIRADFLRDSAGGPWPEEASDVATR